MDDENIHKFRQKDQNVSELVLWEPTHGKKSKGGQPKTFLDIPIEDTGFIRSYLVSVCHKPYAGFLIHIKFSYFE